MLSNREIYVRARTVSRFEQHLWRLPPPVITPDMLRPSDLRYGIHMLEREAARGQPWAVAVLAQLERRNIEVALIPRYALSKHKTHQWTGRRWKEVR